MKNEKNVLAYLALAAVCIIWGTTYLGLRIGVKQFPPFLFSIIRFLTAGPILILLVLLSGRAQWPDKKVLFNQAVSGLFMVTLGISIVGWAEMYISSGVAAIICSMMPIWTVLINVFVTKDEQPNWLIILGLVTGLTGIVLIFGEHLSEFSNSNYTAGIVLTFIANLSWAIGSIWIKKKNTNSNPFLNAGLQMLFGGIFLIPFTLLLDDYSRINWNSSVVYSLAYMSLVGSVAAYACYSYAIKKLPMTLVSLYAYINPIVAVLLGWLVLDEKLNGRIALAILVTIAGIYIVNKGYQMKTAKKLQTA
ncbi:MAG: DMT family transporter [Bacteroidota bacterium]|jgi:drug/metabolite transporter (DMT)-like permease|nr:EamA family transporter [Cytophagales bacterium]MCE2957118.1 EamA family transporter [Flammeovirgaceae bacterium]MCZ8070468.1 EamA family transporter [Cytophagales bacterium]